MPLLVALAAFPAGIIQASFFEWIFHRYWLHRPWLPKDVFTAHTLVHHQLCKFDDTFEVHDEEQHEALSFKWWAGLLLIVINVTPWVLASWWVSSRGIEFPYAILCGGIAVSFSLYYVGYEGFHYLMHKPSVPFIERSRYFQFLKRHHRIHHAVMDRNLNVLLPLADLVLGTFVRERAVPASTPEAARKLARRHSRYGRRMRGESR